jgi:hypothetical protein
MNKVILLETKGLEYKVYTEDIMCIFSQNDLELSIGIKNNQLVLKTSTVRRTKKKPPISEVVEPIFEIIDISLDIKELVKIITNHYKQQEELAKQKKLQKKKRKKTK